MSPSPRNLNYADSGSSPTLLMSAVAIRAVWRAPVRTTLVGVAPSGGSDVMRTADVAPCPALGAFDLFGPVRWVLALPALADDNGLADRIGPRLAVGVPQRSGVPDPARQPVHGVQAESQDALAQPGVTPVLDSSDIQA